MNRIIEWFARNRVAANLLMVFIIAAGLITLPTVKEEVFPEFSSDIITVGVDYLGAAPEEVEEGVCVRVEEAVYGLAGIKKVTSKAVEGRGTVTVELLPGSDVRKVLDEVKARVDAIDTFPEETEKPIVEELVMRRQVIDVAVFGNTDLTSLRELAERVRDGIAGLDGISLVEVANARPYELSIEVSEEDLRRHGITFDDVARAVRRRSLDLPGGSVKTAGGQVLFRAKGQAYTGREFEDITLLSRRDGTRILLGEVADVVDGFEDTDQATYFDGRPGVLLKVFRIGEQSALYISSAVKEYVDSIQSRIPDGIFVNTWQDDAAVLRSRLHLLIDNGLMGLALVCICLALFLRLGLALWVAFGIPLSFLGAIWLLPGLDVSINLISLFAFLVVLGMVVDDAIVVGENIFTHYQRGARPMDAAIEGTKEVALPVVFAIMTSVAAFAPLLTVPGNTGKIMKVVPSIVICTLIFSLVESLFILPHHLSHLKRDPQRRRPWGWLDAAWRRFQGMFGAGLKGFVTRVYGPVLAVALRWRYASLAIGLAVMVLTTAYVASGRMKFIFFPEVDADNVVALLTMPQGTSVEVTERAVRHLERTALQVLEEFDGQIAAARESGEGSTAEAADGTTHSSLFNHVVTSIGGQPYREAQDMRRGKLLSVGGGHLGEVNIELLSAEDRAITSTEVARRWRELAGAIPDATELTYTSSLFSAGDAINIQLASSKPEDLRLAAERLKGRLGEFPGVTAIADSFRIGKQEVRLGIRAEAETLGLTLEDVARQVRQGFYGEEAQRIQRGRHDVRVMVRYPEAERRSLGDLEGVRIRTRDGTEVDFSQVASAEYGRGYAAIDRADRKRVINVTADVDDEATTATEVLRMLEKTTLPELLASYPGLSYTMEGEQREQKETFGGLVRGLLLSLVLIYALLAIPFSSYVQPMIVMSAIPFGFVGVVLGHMIMGLPLTILSVFGLVALTGVVVNDSLIMVDFINRASKREADLSTAVRQAGMARFRPILLTSVTTFAGLTPLLLEKSMQAQFLIPMAVSLGFGVLFATFVTLLLVPICYMILEDVLRFGRALREAGET